jgi:hypothetical protein
MLSKAILGLFKHLIGPHEVKIQARDKRLILKSIEPLGTLGSFSAEFNPDLRVLLNACNAFYELCEIAKWYKLKGVKETIVKELIKIREDCSQYESEKKSVRIRNERLRRVDIVKRIIKKVELLRL